MTASADPPAVFESAAVTLTAVATGGTPPYRIRWDQNAGPVTVALADPTAETLQTPPLEATGRYVFRALVTDAADRHVQAFAAVEVSPAVATEVPAIALTGEPVPLTADVTTADVTFQWSVALGTAAIANPTAENATLTTELPETVEVVLTVTQAPGGANPVVTIQTFEVVSIEDLVPRVVIETNFGDIILALDAERAPLHTANLLLYANDGFFDGLIFHRNACSPNFTTGECKPFVLQGGGYRLVNGEPEFVEPTRDPVASEADNGLTNAEPYSVSLALSGGNPDSGTTQFFINLMDNGLLDAQGFTVFGSVAEGRDVVDAIVAGERTASPILNGEQSYPAEPVTIARLRRE